MIKVDIKPLSVNAAWKGKRYKTDKYKAFEKEMLFKLKPILLPKGLLHVKLSFGFSSQGSDIDNPIKMVLDILQKKYRFNDNLIYRLDVIKTVVNKGSEYIAFDIKPCSN